MTAQFHEGQNAAHIRAAINTARIEAARQSIERLALTQERLRELFHYDPGTGLFTRLVAAGSARIGSVAGCDDGHGYFKITVDYHPYRRGRLAWLYMTGHWPENEIDHRNLNKADDRWSNLRNATDSQNQANKTKPQSNKSGLKGVSWQKRSGKWRSAISIGHKNQSLGFFDCPAAAHFAYLIAADIAFGEFARAS